MGRDSKVEYILIQIKGEDPSQEIVGYIEKEELYKENYEIDIIDMIKQNDKYSTFKPVKVIVGVPLNQK